MSVNPWSYPQVASPTLGSFPPAQAPLSPVGWQGFAPGGYPVAWGPPPATQQLPLTGNLKGYRVDSKGNLVTRRENKEGTPLRAQSVASRTTENFPSGPTQQDIEMMQQMALQGAMQQNPGCLKRCVIS